MKLFANFHDIVKKQKKQITSGLCGQETFVVIAKSMVYLYS